MRLGRNLGYFELSIQFFLEKALVLRRWGGRVVGQEELGTDLLPMTREEYYSCRCRSRRLIQYNYSGMDHTIAITIIYHLSQTIPMITTSSSFALLIHIPTQSFPFYPLSRVYYPPPLLLQNSNEYSQIIFVVMSSYEQKYKKALRSIQEIIKANKQIKDELDALRTMRQADLDSFTNIQKEEFRKAYEALLKEKNAIAIALQTAQLENEKLKYTVHELENQVGLYRNQKFHRNEDRQTLGSNHPPEPNSEHPSPRKSDAGVLLQQREAELHRTIQNYEQHHANLQRNNKRLEQRIGELEGKLTNVDKNWRIKYEAKELEVIDIKALTRQEFTEQVSVLRKENSQLKLANNDLALRLESMQKNTQFGKQLEHFDWQADLVQEMIQVKANLEPLRQQIGQLQELNLYQREQSVRERTSLQARVLQLQAEAERQQQTIRSMQRKAIEVHQERSSLEQRANQAKRLQQQNQLLNGRIIVMQSRQIALRNRTGEQLQERVLQFENRVQLLLHNKEGLREMREVGIHQLLALKAYIMQLDSRLKELILSNGYLLKKYKSYKEKYQLTLKEHKQYGLTINTLKMKIMGYDKLVLKLQGELERALRTNQTELQKSQTQSRHNLEDSSKGDLYMKKYELMREKLDIQEKYKQQELETFKLGYETRIMELTIKVEEGRSLRETIDLYRAKNQELQSLLSKKETELFESKVLTNSKVLSLPNEDPINTRQTKDIILSLQTSLKQNDETVFRLQGELRIKEEGHKRAISSLQREIEQLRQDHQRELKRREMDHGIALEQQIKKYKLKISGLEHTQQLSSLTNKDDHSRRVEEAEARSRKLESLLQEAEMKREEEVFARRRIEKQVLDLTHDREELQRTINDLQLKLAQFKSLEKQYQQLKGKVGGRPQPRDNFLDYQLQSKEAIIKRLNAQILQLKSGVRELGEKDITISSQKNEIYYMKREIEQLNETINKYNNQIVVMKEAIDAGRSNFHSDFTNAIEDKDSAIGRLRKELAVKEARIHDIEDELSRGEQANRKLRRELTEIDRLREELAIQTSLLQEREWQMQKIRHSESNYEQQLQRVGRELTFVKESYQKVSLELLQRSDEVSRLQLQTNSIAVRSRGEAQEKYSQQLQEKERQVSNLNSQLQSLRYRLNTAEQDRQYQEQNYKRAVQETFSLRGQLSQSQEQIDQLDNQLYFKSAELNKLNSTIEGLRRSAEQVGAKSDETYRMRTEIFSLKSDISSLQEDVFNREAANARLSNQIAYVRTQYSELQEEFQSKQDYLNKLTQEYNTLKANYEHAELLIEQREKAASKAIDETNSLKNKYHDLEEEMQEREQAFSVLTQELNKLKGNLNYYQDEISQLNTQIARLSHERELLRSEIVRLNETISEKNSQVNRAKQEVFALRMDAGDRDYAQKIKIDQELYSLKSNISVLEHEVQDRDSEIRRLNIEIDAVRHAPLPQPTISEQQVQELRAELSKRQREMIGLRYDMEDLQYRYETANNNVTMLKDTVAEYQERMIAEREQYEVLLRDYTQRERRLKQEISNLQQELEQKSYSFAQPTKTLSFAAAATYSEEEVNSLRQQIPQKQRELTSIRYELEDKQFYVESLEAKTKMQENLVRQLQEQSSEERQRYETHIQQYITKEKSYQRNVEEVQEHYEQRLSKINNEMERTRASALAASLNNNQSGPVREQAAQNVLLRPYIEEIDRLNGIIQQLQQQFQIRQRVVKTANRQSLQQQSLIQHHIQTETHSQVVSQNTQTQQHTELYHQGMTENRQEAENEEEQSSSNEEAEEQARRHEANIKGSLIQQLQKEQSFSEGSQVRGGQITIKIQPNAASHPHPLPVFNHKQVVQYIQTVPSGHPVRVIQQGPQQVYHVPQSAPFPGQNIILQGPAGSAVLQSAPPPPQHIRGQSFVSVAAPVNVQPFRAL